MERFCFGAGEGVQAAHVGLSNALRSLVLPEGTRGMFSSGHQAVLLTQEAKQRGTACAIPTSVPGPQSLSPPMGPGAAVFDHLSDIQRRT